MKVAVHQQGDFLRNDEFLLPDGTLPVLSLLNRARKERVQRHLDAKPELAAAAEASKRYTGILNKQP